MTLTIYSIYVAFVSLVAFLMYVRDKKKAKKGDWRTPEATLLTASFLGGGIGGYFGMIVCHHKTKKWYFHAVNLIGIIWQIALLMFLIQNPDILF